MSILYGKSISGKLGLTALWAGVAYVDYHMGVETGQHIGNLGMLVAGFCAAGNLTGAVIGISQSVKPTRNDNKLHLGP